MCLMHLPKFCKLILPDERVYLVIITCLKERRNTSLHNEEDYSESKEVYHSTIVSLASQKFRCHVAWRTNFCFVDTFALCAFKWAHKAIVDDFQAILVVKQDILGL